MSVQRYIDTGLWLDDWFVALPTPDKLLYVYLLTNPQTTIAGIYKTTVRIMHNETGLDSDDIEAILCGFAQDGKAHFRHGYMILPAWPDHQRWEDRPSIRKGIDKVLDSLSTQLLDLLYIVGYRYESPKIRPSTPPRQGGGYPRPPLDQEEPSYSDSDSDTDTDTDSDSDAPAEQSPKGGPVDNLCISKDDQKGRQLLGALAGIAAGMKSDEGGESW